MKDCLSLRDDLKAYLDGELAPLRRLAVRRHLAGCASCREEVTAMEQISNELRAGEGEGLAPDLRARILEQVPEGEAQPAAPTRPWRRPLVLWVAVATAATAWVVFSPVLPRAREQTDAPTHMKAQRAMPSGPRSAADEPLAALLPPAGPDVPLDSARAAAPGAAMGRMAGMGGPAAMPAPSLQHFGNTAGEVRRYAKQEESKVAAAPLPSTERQVQKQADITVEVAKLEEQADAVERMVKEAGGFVANNQLSTGEDGLKMAALTVRVPTGRFEDVLKGLSRLGEVKAKSVTGEDVTEQVSDQAQEARVLAEEARVAEARLRAQKGGNWSQQEEARQLRIRKAQAEGRLEVLRKSAALATIGVQLREKARTHVEGGGFLDEMSDTGRAAVNSFLQAARVPILLLIWVLAYAPVWVPLAIGYRYASRLQRRCVAAREAREWQQAKWSTPAEEG